MPNERSTRRRPTQCSIAASRRDEMDEIRVYSALQDPGTRTHAALPCLHVVLPGTVKSRHGLSLNYYLPRLDSSFFLFVSPCGGRATASQQQHSCLSCLPALYNGLCLYTYCSTPYSLNFILVLKSQYQTYISCSHIDLQRL
jgi:hypothetical protein